MPIQIVLIIGAVYIKNSMRNSAINDVLSKTTELKNEREQFEFVWALSSMFSLLKKDNMKVLNLVVNVIRSM
jgi:hypothetical protein